MAKRTISNADIAALLDKMGAAKQREGEKWSALAHFRAAKAIRGLPYTLTSGAQARAIPGIGAKLAQKIDEILATGQLKSLPKQTPEETEKQRVVKAFKDIWGVGDQTAESWYAQGYRSRSDVPFMAMTKQQRLGLEYMKDLQETVPRSEAEQIAVVFAVDLQKLVGDRFELMLVGSYRRGKTASKDVDMLIYATEPKLQASELLTELVQLRCPDVHVLSLGPSKFAGLVRLRAGSKRWRHVDIWLAEYGELPFALLAHTGSATTNIEMRRAAQRKGLKLTDAGLFTKEGQKLHIRTEKGIFKALGLPYKKPEER